VVDILQFFYCQILDIKSHLTLACEISVIPTATISDIPSLSVRSQQLYTPSIDWHKHFPFAKSRVHIWCWRSVIQNFIEEMTGNISQYVTTTSFWHSNLLQATERTVLWWTRVCTKRILISTEMCEMHVTVKLYRATCSLSDADSHFFPKHKN